MQWLFNLLFVIFDHAFSLIGAVEAPQWVSDISIKITDICLIVNHYFPLGDAFVVVLSCIAITLVMMLISIVLQLF